MAAEHVSAVDPSQAVQEPSTTLGISFMIAAQEVQARFVVVVQAVDSYSVPEQAEGSHAVQTSAVPVVTFQWPVAQSPTS